MIISKYFRTFVGAKASSMKYSIIVPVYNRPDEVDELLQSLCEQTLADFEVIIVEDGSQMTVRVWWRGIPTDWT